MRLDADLLAWFRRERGYQTRINAILRAYMKAHEAGEHRGLQSIVFRPRLFAILPLLTQRARDKWGTCGLG